MKNKILKFKVKAFDDLQRLRIQILGRIQPRTTEIHLSKNDLEYFENLGKTLHKLEKDMLKQIELELGAFPIYDWLKNIKGIGPTLAGVLVSEFDIEKAVHVSQFWAFAGLHVVNGKAPKPVAGEKLCYNSWLRSKLVKVMAESFLKQKNSYSKLYYDYKHRKESQGWGGYRNPKTGELQSVDGHRHNAAKRYMVKMFLKDLWLKWREIEGLPITPDYAEAKLGLVHSSHENKETQVI